MLGKNIAAEQHSIAGNETGEINVSLLSVLLFFFFILGTFFTVSSVVLAKNMETEVSKEAVGQVIPYIEYSQVEVTAEVLEILGSKTISDNPKEKTIMVFGNNEKGFSVTDCLLLRVIYTQLKMPGDGVMVKIPREVNKDCLLTHY